ncbi:MAG TPA: 50S ribosomal protein L30 [Steroidobacteraceae bacterium]|jgi:ribosomal protein L30, bacterial/organelle|nr:50S ribosomal protein L30 [Steroidobacteraceae bacterium]
MANESVKSVKVTLVKSPYGQIARHRATVRGLGLRRMNQTVTVPDTKEIRGMLNASRHLFRVEEA